MDTKQPQSFENEHIKVKVARGPHCLITLDIEIMPIAAEAAYKKAIKEVGKEITIPGFRKGKAPEKVVLEQFAKPIDKDFRDIAVETGVNEALNLIKIFPYEKNHFESFKIHALDHTKGGNFTISYYTMPDAPDVHLKEIEPVNVPEEAFTDESVTKYIDTVRKQLATWTPIKDRVARNDDFVNLTIFATEPQNVEVCNKRLFKLDEETTPPWIAKAVVGKTPGTMVEATSEKPASNCDEGCTEHHHHHDDHFEPMHCRVTLDEIVEQNLPEVNEEFAKRLGCATMEDFDKRSREYAEKTQHMHHVNKKRNTLVQKLLEKYPVEVPKGFVDSRVKNFVDNAMREMAPNEKTDAALAAIERDAHELARQLTGNFHIEFLMNALAQKFNINVTHQEILPDVIREMMQHPQDLQNEKKMEELRMEITNKVAKNKMWEKTLDYILENAGKENP